VPASPSNSPALSVGLAVRNGRATIGRWHRIGGSQDFADLELVVADNASDDGTIELVQDYARMDSRARLTVNPVNIGSHENMNRVLGAARPPRYRDGRRAIVGEGQAREDGDRDEPEPLDGR
jgi:Glycosyl transferase family 2